MSVHQKDTSGTPTKPLDADTQMSVPMEIQIARQLQLVSQTVVDRQCAKVPAAYPTPVVPTPSVGWRTTGPTASVLMVSPGSPTTACRDVFEFLHSAMMTELAQHPWSARNAGADLPAQRGTNVQPVSFALMVTASKAVCKTRTASTKRFAWTEIALLVAGRMKTAATMKLVF